MKRTTTLALVLLLPVIALRSSPAIAQGSARSMDFDVSIRSAGMGGASNAVLWSGGLNHWANPALLGAERGIRGEWGRTHLIPEIADDVIFETQVLKIAGGGVGIVMSGTPFGRGVRLDYGVIEITDPSGNPIGTFEAFEQVNSWGFGVSVFEAIESVTQLRRDGRGPLSRYVDVAFGMNFKDVEVDIAPQIGAQASAMARDWGATLRITPVDVSTEAGTPIRLDAALGISVLSANDDARLSFPDSPSPVTRHRRGGVAVRFAADPSAGRPAERGEWSWFHEGFSPLLSLGIAADRAKLSAGAEENDAVTTNGAGVELAFANILWGRAGHFTDRVGDIEGATWGWGVQLPFGRVAGIRYDGARSPQPYGLKHLQRHGVSVWFDPFALIRALETRGDSSI